MDNIVIVSLMFIVLLFTISFVIVYNYRTWALKRKNKFGSYSKTILDTIAPDNNSKALHTFIEFIDTNKPQMYTLKGNKYE